MTIDRAIEILDPEHRERYESIEPVNEACRMGIEALKRQRWIPVTERLPEPEMKVLVLDRHGHMMDRTMRQLPTDKTPVFRPDGLMPGKHITHWMPLPEPPTEEVTTKEVKK